MKEMKFELSGESRDCEVLVYPGEAPLTPPRPVERHQLVVGRSTQSAVSVNVRFHEDTTNCFKAAVNPKLTPQDIVNLFAKLNAEKPFDAFTPEALGARLVRALQACRRRPRSSH